jgi:hypothetical protein
LLAALLALVAFGAAVTEAAFVHTDDGCAVELHCLACRTAVSGVAVLGPDPAPAPHLLAIGLVATPAPAVARPAALLDAPSRAPPA